MAVSTLQGAGYVHVLAATDKYTKSRVKVTQPVERKMGEKKLELQPRLPTLVDLDIWLRDRVCAKASVVGLSSNTIRPTARHER